MQAIVITVHGGPEVLTLVEREDPAPGPGQVLVRNAYIGVNYVDLQHRAGTPYPTEVPLIPGTEAGGTVVSVGAGVDHLEPGQRVVHFGHMNGVYAELTAAPADHVVAVPDPVGLDLATAVALQGTTAHVLTRLATRVGAGDTVVVHAAAGGTGSSVAALARAAGARVIGIVSREGKRAHAGGDVVVVGTGAGLDEPADYVFDAGGAATLSTSLSLLGDFGTLVLYGQTSGTGGTLDVGRLSGLTPAGHGSSLTVKWVDAGRYLRSAADRTAAMRAVLSDVDSGVLRPRITHRIPLAEAAQAHRIMADRATTGKILLTTSTGSATGRG